MHYAAGDKVVFRLIWQDYEGRGKAPSSFTISLQMVNVDTGVETVVSPTLIAAATLFTGVYVYYYTVPVSGNYTFCARGVTADTGIMSLEVFGEFESGRAWVEAAKVANSVIPPTEAQMNARTLLAASYATAANQTTILARLGAWTGTGINTLLGAFKALFSKVATLPTDITGTMSPVTDSVEAISEKLDAIDLQLDSATVTTVSLLSGNEITCYTGMQLFVDDFPVLGNITDYNKLYFTAKESKTDLDADALIQVEKTAGLLVINKAVATTAANGTLAVTNLVTGAVVLTVVMAEVSKLTKYGSGWWDLKAINTTSGATIVMEGSFIVDYNVTRKIT